MIKNISIYGIIILVLGLFNLVGEDTPEFTYHQVTVKTGDTMWGIASKFNNENIDIRQIIYHMKTINHISDSGVLTPGMIIKVPSNLNMNKDFIIVQK